MNKTAKQVLQYKKANKLKQIKQHRSNIRKLKRQIEDIEKELENLNKGQTTLDL